PNAKSFNLNRMDSALFFSRLPEGKYSFVVSAKDASGAIVNLQSVSFTVQKDSTFSVTGANTFQATMKQGTVVVVKGQVTSTYNMTYVSAQLKNTSGKMMYSGVATPNSSSFNLGTFDKDLYFSRLPQGSYSYTISAKDASGTSKTLQTWYFTIYSGDSNLGALSALYESNGNPGVIGNTAGDPGGKSYGAWQLASNEGSVAAFISWLKSANPSYASTLSQAFAADGYRYGSNFDAAWRRLAANDSSGFLSLQRSYIKTEYYDKASRLLLSQYGFNVNSRSFALRNVLWSTAVQHGPYGAPLIFSRAGLNGSDRDIINRVYNERSKVSIYFPRCSVSVQNSVLNRFKAERQAALAML
ncbi:MAG: hypothetical protein FWF71_06370, partial [Actinomycetia bacterium]|nr:hypothetical protein [Actinomycetes bacterium]